MISAIFYLRFQPDWREFFFENRIGSKALSSPYAFSRQICLMQPDSLGINEGLVFSAESNQWIQHVGQDRNSILCGKNYRT
jgi:hypothetical protein